MLRLVLLRVLESYFRHRWLYLLPIILSVVLAAYFLMNEKQIYYAQGVLYVQNESYLASLTNVRDSSGTWWATAAQGASQDMNELLQTDAFVRALIQQTDLEANMNEGDTAVKSIIDETRESISIFTLGDNQIVVGATREEPEVAYQLVNAVVEGYLQWQINAQLSESETAQSFFNDLIKTYEVNLNAAQEEMKLYLEAHPAPLRGDRPGGEQIDINRLQTAIDLASTRYATTLDKEENSRLSIAQIQSDTRQKYFLIDAPRMPIEPSNSLKSMAVKAAVFLVAGMVLSVSAIVGAAIIDRSLRLPIDVSHRLNLPLLALVPDMMPRRKWFQRQKKANQELEKELKEGANMTPMGQKDELTSSQKKQADGKAVNIIV